MEGDTRAVPYLKLAKFLFNAAICILYKIPKESQISFRAGRSGRISGWRLLEKSQIS